MIQVVLKQAGLLQSEGAVSGENLSDARVLMERKIPEFIAKKKQLKKGEQGESIDQLAVKIVDLDGDAVPGYRFGGGEFGAAPVLIFQTSVATPFSRPLQREAEY